MEEIQTGYSAYLELKEEYGELAYRAFNALCVEKKDPVGTSITKGEILEKVNEMKESERGKSDKKTMTPFEFAKAVYENKQFVTPNGELITIVQGPDIEGNVTGIDNNGKRIKTNARDLQVSESEPRTTIDPKEALKNALKQVGFTPDEISELTDNGEPGNDER